MSSTLKLITWNIHNGGGPRIPRIVEALADREPDVVALQETFWKRTPELRELLGETGLEHSLSSFDLAEDLDGLTGPRRYGVLVASRSPLKALGRCSPAVPWPERLLACRLDVGDRELELYVTHLPVGGGHGWIKVEHFEGLYKGLVERRDACRILLGDFNTPNRERPSGKIITFGAQSGRGSRWIAAEYNILRGLELFGMRDVYRELHGPKKAAVSWVHKASGNGFRLDHAIVDARLPAISCTYIHEWRKEKLSDHSGLEIGLEIGA